VYRIRYTPGVAEIVPIRELRSDLAHFIDRVADLREHVVVTRRGKPAAVLIPVDEYEALEETAEILADTDTLAAIEEGMREVERGKTVSLDDLRAELERRRRQG
jgi:antitoxin YefM